MPKLSLLLYKALYFVCAMSQFYAIILKNASAFLLRGARHAQHDKIHLRASAIRRRL